MQLILLTVPACPNAAAFEERLAAALAGHPGAVVGRREVADAADRRRGPVRRAGAGAQPVVPALPGRGRAHRPGTIGGVAPAGDRGSQPD